MNMFLETKNKRSIREAFMDNITYQTVKEAYKQLETEMQKLCFSPEEIWVNSFIVFDEMLKETERIESMTQSLWNDIFCELRNEANDTNRDFEKTELENATSCIVYVVISYMMASDDICMIRHIETLMQQISEHSDFVSIEKPFMNSVKSGFCQYIQEYIKKHKFISATFYSPQNYADPIKPLLKPADRQETKNKIAKRLAFMKGVLPNRDTRIMSDSDYNKMIESVNYLIENNVVKKQESSIQTSLPVAHLRYTFYLVFKNEGKCIDRQFWIDFLVETFAKMKSGKDSLGKHFSDKPTDYPYNKTKRK